MSLLVLWVFAAVTFGVVGMVGAGVVGAGGLVMMAVVAAFAEWSAKDGER